MEFLADIYEQAGDKDHVLRAVEVSRKNAGYLSRGLLMQFFSQLWKSLAHEHDTIRRK